MTFPPLISVLLFSGFVILITRHRSLVEMDHLRELTEKEERYRTLLETTFAGICVLEEGVIVDANPGFAYMFEYTRSEIIGESLLDLMSQELRRLDEDDVGAQTMYPDGIPVKKKDGSIFYIEAISRIQNYEGRVVQVIAIRDVTEQVQGEINIREQKSLG